MAELQMKLKQFDKAERTVAQALDAENNGQKSDLNSLMTQVEINLYSGYIFRQNATNVTIDRL